jgi:MoxR-like ATPase
MLSHPNEKFQFPKIDSVYASEKPEDYIPSLGLVAAVNVALALGQPLLLTGEPGTGKTGLAGYIAFKLGLEEPVIFNAQTISTKKDLFYQYDALGHFHWAQVNKHDSGPLTQADFEGRLNLIRYEGLGLAIRRAHIYGGKRSIVLIDEIDKAPRDLPNDLLDAIDKLRFDVPEIPGNQKISYECPRDLRPIIIITSNSEKNLPDAFLRRVIFFHIDFPEKEELLQILEKRTNLLKGIDLKSVIDYFIDIRENFNLGKKPATAELIAWSSLLSHLNFPTGKLKNPSEWSVKEKEMLRLSHSILAKTREDLEKLNSALNPNQDELY